MKRLFILIIAAALLIALGPICRVLAADVTFGWDANTESDLAGYKLYQSDIGLPDGYKGVTATDIPLSALANPNDPKYTVTGVPDGTWYWVLTAYDSGGLESGYSNEVTKTIDTQPPAPPQNFFVKLILAILKWFWRFLA